MSWCLPESLLLLRVCTKVTKKVFPPLGQRNSGVQQSEGPFATEADEPAMLFPSEIDLKFI